MKIVYVVSDLKRVGPTNQTFNIIANSKYKANSIVITLFDEPNDTMIAKYEKSNITIRCLHLNRNLYFLYVNRLKKELSKYDPMIIHSYGVKADYLCHKACKKTSWIHVITLRNYPKEDILTRMSRIKGIIALRQHLHTLINTKYVVCCSKTIKDKMSKDYPNKKFYYIQNGVDIDLFAPVDKNKKNDLRKKYKIGLDATVFVCTNSFIPRKRIEKTIEFFEMIPVDNKILYLLGEGQLLNQIQEKYKSNKIIYVGKTDKVIDYLKLSDYFISTSASEGLPNAVLEAIACGLPVLLSDIPQHKEILDEIKDAGKIININTFNKENVKREYCDIYSKEYDNMKKNTQKIKNSVFTMKNMSLNYMKLYEKIGDGNVR